MELRRAVVDEAPELADLRNRLAEWMLDRGIEQWQPDQFDVTAANGTLQQWYTDRGYEIVGTREFDHPGWNAVVLLEKSLSGRAASS